MAHVRIDFELNHQKMNLTVHPMARLLDVIREECELTGTKEGCGEGECGACSVFLDGKLVNSCLIPMAQIQGAKIETIESLDSKKINPIQQAFLECGGAQCGICTPGMILATQNIFKKYPQPTDDQIREGLGGNLCRCTGYTKIFDSVKRACQK